MLDEQVRHGSAHTARSIDICKGIINILDAKEKPAKVVKSYTINEFWRIQDQMVTGLWRVLYPTILLSDVAMTIRLLKCSEYKRKI